VRVAVVVWLHAQACRLTTHRASPFYACPFDPAWRVSEQELASIVEATRWAPTAHNMQNFRLVVVDDRAALDQLGQIRAPVSPTFIVEK
jgi:hypothetical protein